MVSSSSQAGGWPATPRVAVLWQPAFAGGPAGPASLWLEALAHAQVNLEALCVVGQPAVAQDLGRRCGARWPFARPEQLLGETEFDVGVVLAPLADRAELARLLLRSRRHVLTAGLPAADRATGAKLAAAAAKAGRQVLVGLPARFSPAVRKAADLVRCERYGPVAGVTFDLAWPAGDAQPAGAVDLEPLALAVDVLVAVVGLPAEALARATPLGCGAALLTSTSGALATLSWSATRRPERVGSRLVIRTTEGAVLTLEDLATLDARGGSGEGESHRPAWALGAQPRVELGLAGLLADVLAAGPGRRGPGGALDLAHWLDTWRVADAIVRSAESGKGVRV